MKKTLLAFMLVLLGSTLSMAQEDAIKDSLEVFFELDKATLKEESIATIDENFEKYKDRLIKMRVTGHTCDIGSDYYNMGLSEKRAQAAFEYIRTLSEAYQEKCELFFFGEKEQKYDERKANRRVHVLFYLEDDDRDTLIKNSCAEVFIEKKSYSPAAKNKDMAFELKYFDTDKTLKTNNISVEDVDGRKLYFNSVVHFKASYKGSDLAPSKNLKIKLPLVNDYQEGFSLYKGSEKDGKIVWTNTGKPCVLSEGADCKTYDFDYMLNGYCACAKKRKCEEDCNPKAFFSEQNPDLKSASVRYSGDKTVAQFAEGTYASLDDVTVIDDVNFDEDLDICGQFKHAVTTDNWYPSRWNVQNPSKNIVIKSANEPNKNNQTRIYLPKSQVEGMKAPALLKGERHSTGKYATWSSDAVAPTTCLGEVDCDYVVFDVPATGLYKLCEWEDGDAKTRPDKYILKTRVLKGSKIFIGDKSSNEVYIAKNATRKGKQRPKEYNVREYDNASDIVLYIQNTTKKKPMYQEVKLSDLIYKKAANMYIVRLRDFKKVEDFNSIEFTECK